MDFQVTITKEKLIEALKNERATLSHFGFKQDQSVPTDNLLAWQYGRWSMLTTLIAATESL